MIDSLNQQQQEAIMATDGPVLIISGPGSGKTKVLIHRIAYLIQEKKVSPKNILAITFTNKAAQEIKSRLISLLNDEILPTTGTFHSICAQILRKELSRLSESNGALSSNFTIYDENDSHDLIKKIIKTLNLSSEYFKVNAIKENISRAKNKLINEKDYENEATEFYTQTISQIYHHYQKNLQDNNALDFDDLIMLTIKILQNPEILQKYQNKFQYIMIDEYQDTNYAQYVFANLLARQYKNLCVIGDESQSIYSWRGADISNILNFQKDYPETKTILLEQNYRCTQNILSAAHAIISQNKYKLEKKLWTNNGDGGPILLYQATNEKDEADFISTEINKLVQYESFNYNDIAIFYRTNSQSRPIEESFLRWKFPYKIIGNVKFYERKEVKDLIAILRMLQNPNDSISLERLEKNFKKDIFKNDSNKKAKTKKEAIILFIENLKETPAQNTLADVIKIIFKKTNYKESILDGTKEGECRWENIQELISVMGDYEKLSWQNALQSFLERSALASNNDEIEEQTNLINLMTLHCAKGLEFPIVFMIGCEEGIFPHSRSYLNINDMEEERRLCYVGITRAKKTLYLISAEQRYLYGSVYINQPSRFINEIPQHLIKRLLI